MKSKLLIDRKINALKSIMEIDDLTYEFLSENVDTLGRLYEYCSQKADNPKQFTSDESLFHLTIYMNGKEVYSIDYSTEFIYDATNEFLESGTIAKFTEVQVNNKLFAFMKGNEILIQCIPTDNIPLLNQIQSTPGWKRLSGT